MRRVLCLWLPCLPLERLSRKGDPRSNGPFAIICELKNAWRVVNANALALEQGVAPGQSLADGRAICPNLLTEPADPVREKALLQALRRWADQLSPVVALQEPDVLMLDIQGCAHLFGGEPDMAMHATQRLSDLGFTVRAGIADTRLAALALAKYGSEKISIAPAGDTAQSLIELPIEALECDPPALKGLKRAGFKTLGQLFAVKSADLARRYGVGLTKARAALLGHEPDPVRLSAMEPAFAARMSLPEPVGLHSDLQNVLHRLSSRICEQLKDRGQGARRFHLVVRCADSGEHKLQIGFAKPCAEPENILQQFSYKLDKLKLVFGADWFRLWANQVEALHPRQSEFTRHELNDAEEISQIISTIGNRIGFDRLERFIPRESHIPEYSAQTVEAATSSSPDSWPASRLLRPILLYDPPKRLEISKPGRPPAAFAFAGTEYCIKAAQGPERLTPEWWRNEDGRTRDYWKVQTCEGQRFWLLSYPSDPNKFWYMAGRFA